MDHVNLADDGASLGVLHQGTNVTDGETNEEVHDYDGEQNDIGSKEKGSGSYILNQVSRIDSLLNLFNKRLTCKL